jgi:hypothetical protein
MGTKRVGWARIKSLINENTGDGAGLRRNWVTKASGSADTDLPAGGTTASTTTGAIQTTTTLIIGKNSKSTAKPAVADPFTESSTQLWPLGTELKYGDRTFRYGQMNGAVTAGKLLQQAAHVAHHTNCTITNADAVEGSYSHAAGSNTISLETNGTDLTLNQYAEGYLYVNDAQGEGQMLRIKSHPAHDHSDDASVVIETWDPLSTAVVKNASQVSLVKNPYADVIVAPAAETGALVGVTVIDMTDDYFGWFQTRGPVPILVSEAVLVIGHRAVRSDADAGGVMAADSDPLLFPVGQVMASGVVDTEYALIMLNLGI